MRSSPNAGSLLSDCAVFRTRLTAAAQQRRSLDSKMCSFKCGLKSFMYTIILHMSELWNVHAEWELTEWQKLLNILNDEPSSASFRTLRNYIRRLVIATIGESPLILFPGMRGALTSQDFTFRWLSQALQVSAAPALCHCLLACQQHILPLLVVVDARLTHANFLFECCRMSRRRVLPKSSKPFRRRHPIRERA